MTPNFSSPPIVPGRPGGCYTCEIPDNAIEWGYIAQRRIVMSASESQIKANKKYHAKFERVFIRVSPEEKVAIEKHAEKMNEITENLR